MPFILFLKLMSVTLFSFADEGWKVIGSTSSDCPESVQIMAKVGEKFVYVIDGEVKTKLASLDGAPFHHENSRSVIFTKSLAAKTYSFTQPSMVDPNPAKVVVKKPHHHFDCKMILK